MAIVISGVNNNDKITASDGTIDLLSGVNYAGIITAPAFTTPGNLTAGHLNIGSGIQLGNAGIITATTLVGNVQGNINHTSNLLLQISGSEKFRVGTSGQLGIGGANYGSSGQVLTSGGSGSAATWSTVSGTTINNNADNRVITGSGTANTLNAESTLTWSGVLLDLFQNTTAETGLKIRNSEGSCLIRTNDDKTFVDTDELIIRNEASTERLRIDSSGLNVTGVVTATSFSGDGSALTGTGVGSNASVNTSGIITATAFVGDFAPRNMIINGAMQINQRLSGTLTINSSSSQYPCDRWVSRGEGGSKTFTIEKTSIASSGRGIRNALKVTSSQSASVGSSDIFNVRQMIEGYNIQRLNLGEAGCASMALSFTAYSSVAGTHSGAIQNSAQNRSYPFTYTLVANTWTDVKITIPPITSGSFNEADGVGLRVVFDLGCGNNFRGTANQWNSAQDEGATGAVRILETNGATWYVTKVQLEEGAVATKYEKKLVGEEIRNCMRYYQRDLNRRAYWGSGNVSGRYFPVHFITEMRATPSISFHSTSLDSGSASAHSASRQGYNFNMSGSGRFYEWAHVATAEI